MKKLIPVIMSLFALAALPLYAQHEAPGKKAPAISPPPPCLKKNLPPPQGCRGRHFHPHKKGAPCARAFARTGKGNIPRHCPRQMARPVNKGCVLCNWKYKMLREDDAARFRNLARKIRFARMDYNRTPNAQTEKALQTAINNMVKANLEFEIDRAEKALARAKEAAGEREIITKRIMENIKRMRGNKK